VSAERRSDCAESRNGVIAVFEAWRGDAFGDGRFGLTDVLDDAGRAFVPEDVELLPHSTTP
jgi:hypothetical protein